MKIYPLKHAIIKSSISKNIVGTYRLGILKNGNFEVKYFGRSDTDLQRRLLQHEKNSIYTHFSFETSKSIYDSFRCECRDWHMNMPTTNCVHPFAPKRLPYICPYCLAKNIFQFKGGLND